MPPDPSKFETCFTPALEKEHTRYERNTKFFGALAVANVVLGVLDYVNHDYRLVAMNVLNVVLCGGLVRNATQNNSLIQQELNKRMDQDGGMN